MLEVSKSALFDALASMEELLDIHTNNGRSQAAAKWGDLDEVRALVGEVLCNWDDRMCEADS